MKRKLIIDPGHGGSDTGIVFENIVEKDYVFSMAEYFKLVAELFDFEVYLTRERDEDPTHDQRNLKSILVQAELFISLHVDGVFNEQTKEPITTTDGSHCFYNPNDLIGYEIGSAIMRSVPKNLLRYKPKPTPCNDSDWTKRVYNCIHAIKIPCVLWEMGFITSPIDRSILLDKKSKPALAGSFLCGLGRFLEIG